MTVSNPAQLQRWPPDFATGDYLEEIARSLRAAGIVADVVVLESRDVAKEILDAVTDLSADVIAMATHGRGGLSRLLQGSIAANVVHSVLMPVLLVRPEAAKRLSAAEPRHA